MAYNKWNDEWEDSPETTTPIVAAALNSIENGLVDAADVADEAAAAAIAAQAQADIALADAAAAQSTADTALAASGAVPAGAITMYISATPPTGYLLCDGSSVLRATYAALFAVIGTTYGSADGTHFNVPDMIGRVPVGLSSAGPAAINGLADNDGVSVNSRNISHTHNVARANTAQAGSGTAVVHTAYPGTHDSNGKMSGDTSNVDRPAFLVVTFIIKT